MHVFFSGIGGTGIGPLALIAKQAGYDVSGSDKQDSDYITYLRSKGINSINIGQTEENINNLHQNNPIDWFVYSSAIEKEHQISGSTTSHNHPELEFVEENGIRHTKRDEFIVELLNQTGQKMIAVAGTHGKTTTTAMIIWLFRQLKIPLSYSVGAKISFGDMGEFDHNAKYFIYEADEYDRNFLSFNPEMSILPGIDYDHPDIYPTRDDYYQAFLQFINQSSHSVLWRQDATKLNISSNENISIIDEGVDLTTLTLTGEVNRQNAHCAIKALEKLGLCTYGEGLQVLNRFPGVSRRFESINNNIYSDYAHTPEKISGALQIAREHAGDNVVVVYEGLHNTRQHFIKDELKNLFKGIKKLYIAPSYLAREDESLEMLTPEKLCQITEEPSDREPVKLDENLKNIISKHAKDNTAVLCLSAGSGGSLDEWLRAEFS